MEGQLPDRAGVTESAGVAGWAPTGRAVIAGVTVVWAPTAAVDPVRSSAYSWLTASERARLEGISDVAADETLLGRYLVRVLAAEAMECAADAVVITATCPACGREHGRPQVVVPLAGLRAHPTFPAPEVSVAHAGGLVVAACSPTARGPVDGNTTDSSRPRAIGVDTEPAPPDATRHEVATLRAWTQREAVAKAEGTGIVVEHGPGVVARYVLHDVPTPGAVTSLAVAGAGSTSPA
ncbi:hypothetical protein FH969_04050 [Miniimonas arenae]|uniref:4-phosphopantetheinyl transferase family protein n=1 Tax=Miniimonas arenae TaxID=676201 RepID=A0A5C5BEK8_9MICO|nr:hypothetical protein [Miniimonas arenae]TNU76267.1 hypothetical protein FH969_04050 [Miniimonas arenae]